jgi:hypothetical protein
VTADPATRSMPRGDTQLPNGAATLPGAAPAVTPSPSVRELTA